jgi:hypothetical protein
MTGGSVAATVQLLRMPQEQLLFMWRDYEFKQEASGRPSQNFIVVIR